MSDKDDLFAPEGFGDLGSDAEFFAKSKKKVKRPSSMPAGKSEAKQKTPEEKVTEAKQKTPEEKVTEAKTEKLSKKATKPLTATQKAVNNILRKAGFEPDSELPTVSDLVRDRRQLVKLKISDIAVFIKKPSNEVLAELFKKMPLLNRVNLSAQIDLARVKMVGGQVLSAKRMYQAIQVARIESDGRLECTSGRHRLVFLALVYGPDSEVVVQVEDMSLNEARDAVVVANVARKAKAMEQAEHAVLSAVSGDIDADQDELYAKTVTNKSKAKKYCTYSVLERNKPLRLKFELGTRKEGALASITNIEGFWGSALEWHREMGQKEFDASLKASIQFLNSLATAFKENPSFDASQHMSAMTLTAIGKYYKAMTDAGVDEFVGDLVDVVVAMGAIGRQKSDETYSAIVAAMKKRKK